MSVGPVSSPATERVRQELRLALRSGPFSSALHLAIEHSGLSLESIRIWLSEHGVLVSVPTLSYWRRGRSRPERRDSLRAVRLLEGLLRLPTDSLMSLLGPPRRRGRWIGHVPGSLDIGMLFDESRPVELLNDVGVPVRGALSRISTQVTVTVDADRLTRSIHLRELVKANVDKVSRCGVLYLAEEQPANPPGLAGVRYCRLGRAKVDRSTGLTAAELILDRMLDAGERALLEFEWHFSPGMPLSRYEHRFCEPIREYVLQARFEPEAVPVQCQRYDRRVAEAPECNHRELWIGGSNTALLAESDIPAGIVGMAWQWPD